MMTDGISDKFKKENAVICSNSGFALVTVLLLVSLLAVIGITLNRSGGMQATIAHNLNHGEEAYYIANAGLQHAVFKLAGTPTLTGTIFSDVPFGDGSYTVSITSDVTPMGQVLISSTGKMGTAVRTIEKRHFPTVVAYPALVQDSSITKEDKTFNFGISPYVKVGITSTDKQKRGMIAFDLTSLPAGIVIKSAILELYMFNRERTVIGNNIIHAIVHRIDSPWVEGVQDGTACTVGTTWQNKDCITNWLGTDIDTTIQTNAVLNYDDINEWHTWNITNLVQYWYDNPSSNYGLLIKDNLEQGNQETFIAHYASHEYSDANLRPKLTVHYLLP
jgi:hypothetical protein